MEDEGTWVIAPYSTSQKPIIVDVLKQRNAAPTVSTIFHICVAGSSKDIATIVFSVHCNNGKMHIGCNCPLI